MASSWEVYESKEFELSIDPKMDSLYRKVNGKGYKESLIEKQKEAAINQASHFLKVFDFLNLNINELPSFEIIEERSLNNSLPFNFKKIGFVIANDSIYGYRFDPEELGIQFEKLSDPFTSENPNLNQARQILVTLASQRNTEALSKIAEIESDMLAGPLKELQPATEYEIILYKMDEETLKLFYLHETFVQIMNQ